MTDILVIYHHNCLDGFTAAWCFHNKFGQDVCDFHGGIYDQSPPDVTDKDVFIVDFSYPRTVIEKMLKTARNLTIIDHHKSAIEDLKNLFHPKLIKVFDMEKSGAMLTWEFLNVTPAPPFIEYVQDRDLWHFKLPVSREVNAAMFSYDYDFDNWDLFAQITNFFDMARDGAAVLRKQDKDIRELIPVCLRKAVIAGHEVPLLNVPYTLASDAGNVICKGFPFAATYFDTERARVFSLRSSGEEGSLDVSVIAKMFGGGGHPKASGFRVPRFHALAYL